MPPPMWIPRVVEPSDMLQENQLNVFADLLQVRELLMKRLSPEMSQAAIDNHEGYVSSRVNRTSIRH